MTARGDVSRNSATDARGVSCCSACAGDYEDPALSAADAGEDDVEADDEAEE
jgi:hypothetical protein